MRQSRKPKLTYRSDLLVYTADATGYREADLHAAFERVFPAGDATPVVLFVHGRGDEPQKSLAGTGVLSRAVDIEGKAVRKLEAYGVRVLYFSWDSKRGTWVLDRQRPLDNTADAAEKLGKVLTRLQAWRASHATTAPLILLAHSIGTIVLKRYLERLAGNGEAWPGGGGEAFFANVLLSSADADDEGHDAWLEQIPSRERVFVTFNPHDHVLNRSYNSRKDGVDPLGLGKLASFAKNATYVDLIPNAASDESFQAHESFNVCTARGHVHVVRFYDDVLHGRAPRFANGMGDTRGNRVALVAEPHGTHPLIDTVKCGR